MDRTQNNKATNHFLVWSRRGATTTHRDAVPACCESFGRQHVRRHQIVHMDPVHPSLRVSESESEQPALHVELIWRRIDRNAFLPPFLKFSREFYFMMYRYTNRFQVSIWNQSAVSFKKNIFYVSIHLPDILLWNKGAVLQLDSCITSNCDVQQESARLAAGNRTPVELH